MVEREYAVFRFGVHQDGACIVYLQTQAVLHVASYLLIRRSHPDDNFDAVVTVNILKSFYYTDAGYLVEDSMFTSVMFRTARLLPFGLYRNSGH